MDNVLKGKIESCCITAWAFTKVYYQSFDKRRHAMEQYFLDDATFVWNGNGIRGKENIQRYLLELPITEHNITTLDAQPLVDNSIGNQVLYLIQTGGTVSYGDYPAKAFQQTFIITSFQDQWKIASDCYRIQDALLNM